MKTITNFVFRIFSILALLALLFGNLGTTPSARAAAANLEWTWVDGANIRDQRGIYGTEDVPGANNVPGARYSSPASWVDANGSLWLFGGHGYSVSATATGRLNDLWMFDPASGQWTWVDGATTIDQPGVYGTEDLPAAANVPGARGGSVSWMDANGSLWLFGGFGHDGSGIPGQLNDLWKFSPASGQWTWVDGTTAVDQAGVYGTEDLPAANNVPGGRSGAVSWMDAAGNLWLFGGYGADSAGNRGELNDLWKFNPSTEQWTWVDGSNVRYQSGVYGTEDVPAANNVPGARNDATSWMDANGSLWLFGGYGYDGAGNFDWLNDLWKFNPASGQWTWADGSTAGHQTGVYGTEDVPAINNVPGARYDAVSWMDASGNLWLFGGNGYDGAGNIGNLDDLWMFNPASGHWTWADGSWTSNQIGIYGTEDVPGPDNVPGGRQGAVSWIDARGSLWLFGGYGYDGANTVGYLNDLWRSSDVGAPTVTSILRTSPSPTSAASVNFAVAFSEPVSGVASADFLLYSYGVTGATITSVDGSDGSYIVTVNTGNGNGALRLDIRAAATITDLAGNPLSGLPYTSGEVYVINKIITPTFRDVPASYWAWDYIERLYAAGITDGCYKNPMMYCPSITVTRDQMAVFLLRSRHGSAYTPPAATGTMFTDVPSTYWAAAWIEQLANEGITGGCGGGKYCPSAPVTRDQMAVFLLRGEHGYTYVPPDATGTMFADVPSTYWAAKWIEQLANEGITGGCGGGNYCPATPVTRDQMAVFLVRAFSLP